MPRLQICAFQHRWCEARCPAYSWLRKSYIYCILIGFYMPFVLSLFHEKHLLCHMNSPVSKISRSAERIVADAKLVNSTYFL